MLYSLSQRKQSAKQSADESGSMKGSGGDKGEGAEKKRASARRAVVTGARSGKEHTKSKRVKKHTSVKPGSSSKV